MIRKYKSWTGLSLINLLGLIAIYGLITVFMRGFVANPTLLSLSVILIVLFVATIAYINFLSLQFRKRTKEFYVRKLLGARDIQLGAQLILESIVLTTFLAVSGLVLAELLLPWCGRLITFNVVVDPISFINQIALVLIIVIPVGVLSVLFPVRGFIRYIRSNFSKLSHRSY